MKNNVLQIIIKYTLLFIILILLFNIISWIISYIIFNFIFPLNDENYDLIIENIQNIKIISLLNYLISLIISLIITFKYWNKIIDFFKNNYKKILIHSSILILIPLIFSIIFSLIDKSLNLEYIKFLFTFFYWWISWNQLTYLIYYIGIEDNIKIITFFFIKLVIVIIYTNFLWIKNNKILYIISVSLWLIWTITWYIFLWILMSV